MTNVFRISVSGLVVVLGIMLTLPVAQAHSQSSFTTGARVQTTDVLRVRSNAAGAVIGKQLLGAKGTITGGPTSKNGNTWWKINYDSGVDGWSAQAFLTVIQTSSTGETNNGGTTPPATPPVSTTPSTTYTGSCPLPQYPDATCTGVPAGTNLTVVNGHLNITVPNTVIENKDIRGCVVVSAPGVVIRNSKITCPGPYAVDSIGYTGAWLTIEDSEISCNNGNGTAVGEENVTIRRTNIHGCENGFDVNKNFLIQDNYIHDMFQSDEAHTDGIQMWSTMDDVKILHNRIYANNGTSAIISPGSGNGVVLIQDNLFAGGAYTLYCRQNGSSPNYSVINNRFSTIFYPKSGSFGPWTECEDEIHVYGNVYHETGQLLPDQKSSSASTGASTGTPPSPAPTPPSIGSTPVVPSTHVPSTTLILGESAILGGDDSGNGNSLLVQSATLGQAGTLQSMSFYVRAADGNLRLGIYDAQGPNGGPGNLIAQTEAFTPVVGWNTRTLTPVSLSAGTYWLAYFPSSNALHFADASNGSFKASRLTFRAMPNVFPAIHLSDKAHWSLYATLTNGTALAPQESQTASVGTTQSQLEALKQQLLAILAQLHALTGN